jgi:hypothetical protein
MKRLLLAACAVALLAPAATADTGTCVTLTAGEIDALDIVSARAEAVTGWSLGAKFTLAGYPSPRPGWRYTYVMEFHDATYAYEMSIDVDNIVRSPVAGTPYELKVTTASGQTWTYDLVGVVDNLAKTVSVVAFQDRAPILDLDAGAEYTIDAFRTFGGPVVAYGHLDEVTGPHTLVVGDGC